MNQQTQQQTVGDAKDLNKIDLVNVPMACQYRNLCTNDTHRTQNEQIRWLTERIDKLPVWSRLKSTNCVGHPRQIMLSQNDNYEIEIPGRLLSIFGNLNLQTKLINKMMNMGNCFLVSNILALCAALKNNSNEWSPELLDNILMQSLHMYPELLRKLDINEKIFNVSHLNQLYQFEGNDYKVQLQQVATGYVYIRYGLNEFNLARALAWFFQTHQFGLLLCNNRNLAFGCTLDTDNGFFMFDCQSRGFPLFKDKEASCYILRTHHLQVLLYCLIMILNVTSEMVKFSIYSVDIRILNLWESKNLKKEIYVPTIVNINNKVVEKKVDCGPITKNIKTNSANLQSNKKDSNKNSTLNALPNNNSYYRNHKSITKNFKSPNILNSTSKKSLHSNTSLTPKVIKKPVINNLAYKYKPERPKSPNNQTKKEIVLDTNKVYYILSIPKKTNIKSITWNSSNIASLQEGPKLEPIENVTINKQSPKSQAEKPPEKNRIKSESESENKTLNQSDSTITLIPESVNDVSAKEEEEDKLNLRPNNNSDVLLESKNLAKVKVIQQFKDLLKK